MTDPTEVKQPMKFLTEEELWQLSASKIYSEHQKVAKEVAKILNHVFMQNLPTVEPKNEQLYMIFTTDVLDDLVKSISVNIGVSIQYHKTLSDYISYLQILNSHLMSHKKLVTDKLIKNIKNMSLENLLRLDTFSSGFSEEIKFDINISAESPINVLLWKGKEKKLVRWFHDNLVKIFEENKIFTLWELANYIKNYETKKHEWFDIMDIRIWGVYYWPKRFQHLKDFLITQWLLEA